MSSVVQQQLADNGGPKKRGVTADEGDGSFSKDKNLHTPKVSMQALQATDPSSPEQPSPPIAANLFNPICYGFFAPKNSSSKPPTPFPACLRVSVVSPAFVKSPDSEWHTPVKPATRERQIDIAEPGVSLGMYMCGTQAHSQATREHGSTQVEDTPKKNPAVAMHAQGYAEQACTSPTVNCIPTPATHKRPKFSDDAALRGYNDFGDRTSPPPHDTLIYAPRLQRKPSVGVFGQHIGYDELTFVYRDGGTILFSNGEEAHGGGGSDGVSCGGGGGGAHSPYDTARVGGGGVCCVRCFVDTLRRCSLPPSAIETN